MPLVPSLFDPSTPPPAIHTFSCGTEIWASAAANWIRGDGARRSMDRGTRIWLYHTQGGDLVGYGSLGKTAWTQIPKAVLAAIPSLAVQTPFQRHAERFGWQIVNHLLREAWAINEANYVVLEVHENNARAIRLYQSLGFSSIGQPVTKKFDGVKCKYLRMARKFR